MQTDDGPLEYKSVVYTRTMIYTTQSANRYIIELQVCLNYAKLTSVQRSSTRSRTFCDLLCYTLVDTRVRLATNLQHAHTNTLNGFIGRSGMPRDDVDYTHS